MNSRTTLVAAATAATAVAAGGAYAVAMVPGIAGGLAKLWKGGSGEPIPVSADIETALRGKLVLITGPTSGLGLQVARLLAAGGARMVCAVHPRAPRADLEKHCSSNIVDTIDIDLADVASIRAFVSTCRKKGHGPFDVVILNAGVITGHGERTQQGIEMTVGVNFFANAVLAMELVAAGLFAPPPPPSTSASNESASGWTPRLVAIASEGHRLGPRLAAKDFPDREFHYATAYGQSKLFLLSFVFELHRRLRGRALCAALCPGAMKTRLASSLPTAGKLAVFAVNRTMARTPEQVAPEVVRIASMAEPSVPWREARYFSAGREDTPRDDATDPKIGAQLWAATERVLSRIHRGLPAISGVPTPAL